MARRTTLPSRTTHAPRARGLVAGALACAMLGAGCNGDDAPADDTRRLAAGTIAETSVAPDSLPLATGVRVDTIARGLVVPWALAFAPDGRVFLTERGGRVRVIQDGVLRDEPWTTLDVFSEDPDLLPEAGLMGIALAPDFATSRAVYVMGTFWREGARDPSIGTRVWRRARATAGIMPTIWENRVYRCTDGGERASSCNVVVGGLDSRYYHAGGALAFGPDGMLYVGQGDAMNPHVTQGMQPLGARILRFAPDGSIPADNPAPGLPAWATGLRNAQDLDWHPETGELFAIDHGPSGMQHEQMGIGNDELNVVQKGAHYGWPAAVGAGGPSPPLRLWRTGIAPAGMAFYRGDDPAWRGSLFVGGLRGRTLRRLALERGRDGWRVSGEEVVLAGYGRIRAVAAAPDGSIWVTTSNRDGRGTAGPEDDLVLRLTPGSAAPTSGSTPAPRPASR